MVVNNVIIIKGDNNQIEDLKKNCRFQEAKEWRILKNKEGFKTRIDREFEFPNFRLKEISKDYPKITIVYYYFIEKPFKTLSYKVFENGEIIDECFWKENSKNNDERGEEFSKRFFINTGPYEIP